MHFFSSFSFYWQEVNALFPLIVCLGLFLSLSRTPTGFHNKRGTASCWVTASTHSQGLLRTWWMISILFNHLTLPSELHHWEFVSQFLSLFISLSLMRYCSRFTHWISMFCLTDRVGNLSSPLLPSAGSSCKIRPNHVFFYNLYTRSGPENEGGKENWRKRKTSRHKQTVHANQSPHLTQTQSLVLSLSLSVYAFSPLFP